MPTASPVPTPTVACGGLRAADCQVGVQAALAAVAGQATPAIHVELYTGVFCPTPGLLFADTTCPAGGLPPSDEGQWVGSALVSFAGSPQQAYINLEKDTNTVRALLIAIATAPPSTPPRRPDQAYGIGSPRRSASLTRRGTRGNLQLSGMARRA